MKASFIQILQSYFQPVVLEQTGSAYNPQLNILLDKGQYQLCTKDAIYSYGTRYHNFRKAFELIDLNQWEKPRILLLGLGLGAVPYMLEQKFNKICEFVGVEIDGVIIGLANDYVLSDLESYVETYECDASSFFNTSHERFDIIAMDIFQSAKIPTKFQSEEFVSTLKNALSENGVLLYNRLSIDEEDEKQNTAFAELFFKIFPKAANVNFKSNGIFSAYRFRQSPRCCIQTPY